MGLITVLDVVAAVAALGAAAYWAYGCSREKHRPVSQDASWTDLFAATKASGDAVADELITGWNIRKSVASEPVKSSELPPEPAPTKKRLVRKKPVKKVSAPKKKKNLLPPSE